MHQSSTGRLLPHSVLIATWLCLTSVTADKVAYVSQGVRGINARGSGAKTTTLLSALRDSAITSIVLTSNYSVGNEFDEYLGKPIAVTRNVTVTGLPQSATIWDLEFKWAALELCSSCTFTIQGINIANERRGNGASVDIFQGKPGSAVILRNMYRVRPACTTTQSSMELIRTSYKRSARFSNKEAQQVVQPVDAVWLGKQYPDSLLVLDFTMDVPLAYQEGRGLLGGFAIAIYNTSRICAATVSESCLKIKSPDACINSLIDDMQDEQQQAAATGQQQRTAFVTTVAVPVAMAVVVLLAVFVSWAAWHRRQLQQRRQRSCMGSGKEQQTPPHDTGDTDLEAGAGNNRAMTAQAEIVRDYQELLDTKGWHLTNKSTGPLVHVPGDDRIQFGVMLGAGSFGKVYKGRWAGREVAIKVIEHDTDTAAAVENEVQLMVSFKHPNIVRAYHFCTFKQRSSNSNRAVDESCSSGMPELLAAAAPGQAADASASLATGGSCGLSGSTAHPKSLSSQAKVPTVAAAGTGAGDAGHSMPHVSQVDSASDSLNSAPAMSTPAGHTPGLSPQEDITAESHLTYEANSAAYVGSRQRISITGNMVHPSGYCPQQPQLQGMLLPLQQRAGSGSSSQGNSSTGSHRRVITSDLNENDQTQLQQNLPAGLIPIPDTLAVPAAAAAVAHMPGMCTSPDRGMREAVRLGEKNTPDYSRWPGIIDSPSSAARFQRTPVGAGGLRPEVVRAKTMLVLEYCDCGTLSNLATTKWHPDNEDDEQMLKRLVLLRDAAKGLQALHAQCVVHGDLNARNVLVCSCRTSPHGLVAKLADLGLSRVIKQHSTHRTTNTVGTLSHMPPEMLRYGRMSASVDSYAFGIMMWEVFTGEVAFRKLHYGQYFETVVLRNQRPVIPSEMPEDYQLLMESCWSSDPAERPPVERLLECLELMICDRERALSKAEASHVAQCSTINSAAIAAVALSAPPQPANAAEHTMCQAQRNQPVAVFPPALHGDMNVPQLQQHSDQSSSATSSWSLAQLPGHAGGMSSGFSDPPAGPLPASIPQLASRRPESQLQGVVGVHQIGVVTEEVVFNQPGWRAKKPARPVMRLADQERHMPLQPCSLEPSTFIESF